MTGGEVFGSWAVPSDPPSRFGGITSLTAFVTKTILHSPHGRPQSTSVTLIHSKKLPFYLPPTHKERESWMIEVMMLTFLPSAWFRCGHDPTQVKRNQTIQGNFSGNAYCFLEDCHHNTYMMPLMLGETVSCVCK